MVCSKCKKDLIEGYDFCPYCLEKRYPTVRIVSTLERTKGKKFLIKPIVMISILISIAIFFTMIFQTRAI